MVHYPTNPYSLIMLALIILLPGISSGQLKINNVSSTVSTCSNNGSITVDATSASPPLLYSISAGPVTAPVQTGNVFNSLPAGAYVVKVSDGTLNSVTKSVVVGGSYLDPDMTPTNTSPSCPGSSDGQIIGNRLWGAGFGPFTWELIAPSPVIVAPQNSDIFDGLPAGNYHVRLTDGCGGFRTVVTSLNDPPPSNMIFIVPPFVQIVGCDSGLVNINMHADVFSLPFTCEYVTKSGTLTTQITTLVDYNAGNFRIEQILPGFTYGDFLQVTITDNCGKVVTSPIYTAKPFRFCTQVVNFYDDCDYKTSVNFDINGIGCDKPGDMTTTLRAPIIYSVTDPVTNAVMDADTLTGLLLNNGSHMISGFNVKPLPGNKTYYIDIKDSCGRNVQMQFFMPTGVAPQATTSVDMIYPDACVDSAAFTFVFADHFKKNPKLILLSGPSRMGSTKPGYEYESGYTYPDTLPPVGFGTTSVRYDISNLSAGTYRFKVVDSCGTEVFDEIKILPTEVSNLGHSFTFKKGCLGRNELHYTITSPTGYMYIRDINGGTTGVKYYQSQDFRKPIVDSFMNLPSGTYELTYTYGPTYATTTPANNSELPCQVIKDSIVIEGYRTPAIIANNYIKCKTDTYLELLADSSKGVVPYKYEIISGPQTAPVQTGNVFTLAPSGTYTVRIYDVCGNASTSQITVDPVAFPPIIPLTASCNAVEVTYGSSAYYTYNWKSPSGTVYTGDTLNIDPVTAADTGIYTIEKIVSINGCTDVNYTTYHVAMNNRQGMERSICPGSSVTIGTHTYKTSGTYTDTLKNIYNCDSIITLILSVNLKRDSISRTICENEQYDFNGQVLTLPGIYRDTIPTATCDSLAILNLTVVSPTLKITTGNQPVYAGNSIQLDASGAANYQWTAPGVYINDTARRNPQATLNASSWIYLNATSDPDGCPLKDSIYITVLDRGNLCAGAFINIPSAFTPNGDGKNDVFRILGGKISLQRFEVYNRWGEKVFSTNDINKGWNGRYNGSMIPGTFVYLVTYINCTGETKLEKGSVILVL